MKPFFNHRRRSKGTGETTARFTAACATKAVVALVCRSADEILVLEKAEHKIQDEKLKRTGFYNFPGGKVDSSEKFKRVAIEKIKAETGLELSSLEILTELNSENNETKYIYCIAIVPLDSEVVVNEDSKGFSWRGINELPEDMPLSNKRLLAQFGVKRLSKAIRDAFENEYDRNVKPLLPGESPLIATTPEETPADVLNFAQTTTLAVTQSAPVSDSDYIDEPQPAHITNDSRPIDYLLDPHKYLHERT